MRQTTIWTMGGTVAAVTLGLFVVAAEAQQPPAKVAPAAPKAAPAKAGKKAPSACSKLVEAACKAKAECAWVVPTKANAKTGHVASPYCRLKPKGKTVAKAKAK